MQNKANFDKIVSFIRWMWSDFILIKLQIIPDTLLYFFLFLLQIVENYHILHLMFWTTVYFQQFASLSSKWCFYPCFLCLYHFQCWLKLLIVEFCWLRHHLFWRGLINEWLFFKGLFIKWFFIKRFFVQRLFMKLFLVYWNGHVQLGGGSFCFLFCFLIFELILFVLFGSDFCIKENFGFKVTFLKMKIIGRRLVTIAILHLRLILKWSEIKLEISSFLLSFKICRIFIFGEFHVNILPCFWILEIANHSGKCPEKYDE